MMTPLRRLRGHYLRYWPQHPVLPRLRARRKGKAPKASRAK
jgi:hypothetical protein